MSDFKYKQLIGGQLIDGTGPLIDIYNPVTGQLLESFPGATSQTAELALESAATAFESWKNINLVDREKIIRNFIKVLKENRNEVIKVLIEETGKPLPNAEYDFDMLTDCLDFFIEQAKREKGDVLPDWEGAHINLTIRKPVGVVVGYLAWNFPLLNLGYKLGPILASGCTAILKPSSQTPLASMLVGKLAVEAGVPKGVINIIVGPSSTVAKTLSSSTIPKMLTLIGSSETGLKIIEQSTTSVKHFSLELGGNAPVVVMKDADIEKAANIVANLKYDNAGQICVNANRVYVHESVKDQFVNIVKEYASKIILSSGDQKEKIFMGPCVSKKAQLHMQEIVDDAVSKGANIIIGGKIPEGEGYFYTPTILDNVKNTMMCYQEEIFGPILPIINFTDSDDITKLANDAKYGLAAYVFTKDLQTALTLSKDIDSGSVCVNDVYYHFSLPHGGCKESGIGKDCSYLSLDEYYYVQRISVKL